jgi:FkbM family methyltransferase
MKQFIKHLLSHTPYRIVRSKDANRFQAIDTALGGLKERGFSPAIIVDAGAHLGWFSLMARKYFPEATCHLIEPQPACAPTLKVLGGNTGFRFHAFALAERPGEVLMNKSDRPNTGAQIKLSPDEGTIAVAATTLDVLFDKSLSVGDRTLLKMDLQGYELHALRGGESILPSIEVIFTEVSFFGQAYEPSIVELVTFLKVHDFELYDIASLMGRSRDNRLCQGDFIFVRKDSQLAQDKRWN